MKRVPLRETPLKTAEVIATVIKQPPGGVNVEDMRKRVRVLDALERAGAGSYVDLEDADHATLCTALRGFSFGIASRELLALIDESLEATEPPQCADDTPESSTRAVSAR